MFQPGFFDLADREALLERMGDPLPKIDRVVDWEGFRGELEKIRSKERKSNAGRKPFDAVLMFKVLVLQQLYNLSDDQTEFQIRDRYSFCRFLGLTPEGRVPDAKTIWVFREQLIEHGLIEPLFEEFGLQLDVAGYRARKGQIIDASIVAAPKQRNPRDENAQIKAGTTPEEWTSKKRRQKDVEARWTKKHGKSYYGYKNHIGVDREHKLIRSWKATAANVHDSQVFEELIDPTNTRAEVWADCAYRSEEQEQALALRGYRSRIHRKGQAGKPLSERAQEANRKRSKVRARVEHIFGQQVAMGGKLVRTIGLARARFKIGMMNLVYNMRRFGWLTADA